MDELKKLLENAGLREGYERTGGNEDELHIAFENIYLHLKDVEPDKAEALLQAMNKVWLILEPAVASTFTTGDGREEPLSGRMSTDDNYGVGGLIDQGR